MSNNHNQPNAPGINTNDGHVKATPRLPPRMANIGEGFASGNQNDILTFETAPRPNEKVQDPQAILNANGSDNNLSYHFPPNSNTNTSIPPYYTGVEVDPVEINTSNTQYNERPEANPYFLFFGKFSSTLVQNMKPNLVGHYDISGGFLNQQPSNIYNIPDIPKDYTMFKSAMSSYNTGNNEPLSEQDIMDEFTNDTIIYDASSCPVNWRVFGPIRDKVLDISENGLGVGTGGTGGTGTDLSFNEFFFKQPEMPIDCSCVFVPAGTSGGNDMIKIKWDKPFNRKSGTSYSQTGNRYFYEDALNPVENWLPHFTEFVLDISGGPNNRTFSKDTSGNFVHTSAFGLFSANNTEINLEARTTPGTASISANGTNYGTSGITTTIIDNFNANSNSVNAGGTPNQSISDLGIGNTYDIAIYYRNESKINTPPGLPVTDLKYNNHNICLFKNIIFGIPGFVNSAQEIVYWGGGGESGRYYLGGIGPNNKDDKTKSYTGEGLNLGWDNQAIIKVGYDCSLNMTGYLSGLAIQAPQQIPGGNLTDLYGIANQSDISYNNFDVIYNLQSNGIPNTMSDTKKNWPNGTGIGGINSNTGVPSANNDYLKEISILAGVPSSIAREHPEYIYTITEYNTTNDTLDKPPPNGTGRVRKEPFSGTLPIRNVIPIWSRLDCNTTGETAYNNPMVGVSETPKTNSKTFLDIYSVVGPTSNPTLTTYDDDLDSNGIQHNFRGRGRQNLTNYEDVIYVKSGGSSSWLEMNSGNRVFKQLANYGTPKSGIISPAGTTPTYDEMVNTDSYIGQVPSAVLSAPYTVSRVEFTAKSGSSNVSNLTSSGSHIIDIPSWATGIVPANLSTTGTTNTYPANSNLGVEFSTSASFDIGENDAETIYSSKRGYYLGFDISNVRVELDPWGSTLPSSGQGGNPFVDSAESSTAYDQYTVGIIHKMKERINSTWLPSNQPIKEIKFRLAKRNPDKIFGDPAHVEITSQDIATLTDFFGVKRLPANQAGNKNNNKGGSGLELQVSFDLDNVDEGWIPHSGDTGSDDLLAEVRYVIDPTSPISTNPQLTIKQDEFTWTNINNNDGLPNGAGSQPSTPGSSPGSAIRFNSFIELHEGVSLNNTGTTDKRYSRSITEANSSPYVPIGPNGITPGNPPRSGRPLFGLFNSQIYYNYNVTYRNSYVLRTVNNYSNSQKILLDVSTTGGTGRVDQFGWDNDFKELFWDYTWPIIGNSSTIPAGEYLPTTFSGCELLQLPSFTPLPAPNATDWNSSTLELPVLGGLTDTTPYYATYQHNITLQDRQSMWCHDSFVGSGGPAGTLITNDFDNPYTNYSNYKGQTQNYSGKITLGSDITGLNVSGSNAAVSNVPNGSGGFNGFNTNAGTVPYDRVKWILLKQKTVTNNNVTVKVTDKTGNSVNLGDYLLFYCEYRNSPSYDTNGGTARHTYSTWLNAISISVPSSNAITRITNTTTGGNNGCNSNAGTITEPEISDLGTGTGNNKTKYFLFGLKPGTRIGGITLT